MQVAKISILTLVCLQSVAQAEIKKIPQNTQPAPSTAKSRKIETNSLGSLVPVATPSATPVGVATANKNQSKAIAGEDGTLDAKAEKDLLFTLKSLSVVIARTPPGPARDRLVLNRAVANSRIGRQKVLSQKRYELTPEIKAYLNASLADAEVLIKNPKTSPDLAILAHDIAGTSALYLEKNDLSRAYFLKELKLNPPSEKAGRIGLTIAEQDFNQGQFQEAAHFYTQYFSKMTPKWKELAFYKLGWCMINLKQADQAKAYFLRIAKANSPTGIGRDAIRDLAYVTSSTPGSVPEVAATQAKIPNLEDQVVYLSDVLANLEALNFPNEHGQVADRLLKLDKNPVTRVGILLSQVRLQKKAFASAAHLRAFTVTADYVQKLDEKSLKAVLAKHEASLELESENIFRAFIDTALGRVKSLEASAPTPAQVFAALNYQLQFFRKFFTNAPHFPIIVELWENLVIDNKDWARVDEITQFIIGSQPKLPNLLENAYLNQIAALDQLNTDAPRRAQRLREYVEKFPGTAKWSQVAKWYAQSELAQGRPEAAQKVWTVMMEKEPSEDNFYQLQYTRFKLGDYLKVLDDPLNKTYLKPQSNLMELYREASLKIAETAKQGKDSVQYRKRVEEFIALSTDPQKARIARIDYFNYLISNNLLEDAQSKFTALSAEEKKFKEYEGFRQELWKSAVDQEMYDLSVKAAPSKQQQVLSQLLSKKPLEATQLDALPAAERSYFLGMEALFNPDFAIQYLKKSPLRPADRDLLILSYRIKLNQWQLNRTPELERELGKKYAFAEISAEVLPIEKSLDAVKFPDLTQLSAARQSKQVEENLNSVRKNRKLVLKAIAGKSPETQFRVLTKMEGLEAGMGQFLLSAPLPPGLTPEQSTQYQDGLKSAAEEFTQQSEQFKLLATKSKEGMEKSKNRMEARTLPQPDMAQWPWPEGVNKNNKLQAAFKLVKNGNLIGGMVLLDYLRATELKTDEIFFAVRAGIILQSNPSGTLRIYLLEELEKNKQNKLIEQWSTMTHHAVPEVL